MRRIVTVWSVCVSGCQLCSELDLETRKARPKGPRAQSGEWDSQGGGSEPPHQLRDLGNVVSSPNGLWGRASENVGFGVFKVLRNNV